MNKFRYSLIIGGVLLCVILYQGNRSNNFDVILSMEYEGQIVSIYRDEYNHNVYKYVVKKNNGKTIEDIGDHYCRSWLYTSVGDSVIKKKGESFITIKKPNGSFKTFETRVKK